MHPIKYLKSKKGRDETGLFIVEGEKFVNEIPGEGSDGASSGWKVRSYCLSKSFAEARDISVYEKRARCDILSDTMFESLSDTETPQGIIAVCEQRSFTVDDMLRENCFLLMGENLADPGNVGTLIRTAAAAGANGVILGRGSAELWNPKVLRASAGAALRVPVAAGADVVKMTGVLKRAGVSVYAAHPRGETLPYNLSLKKSFCFMIGNESRGLTDEAAGEADALVVLPMPGHTESLNASVAGAVLMYEAVRQRM